MGQYYGRTGGEGMARYPIKKIAEKEYRRTVLGWAAGMVSGMLEMVQSQWNYCCGIVHKR